MPVFKLTLAYDGAGLVGWQRQAAGTSVQQLLEDAVAILAGRRVAVVGAGRTDAGVHALGQVASLDLERQMDGSVVVRALNAHLPPHVRVLSAVEVPSGFHARFDARSKTYRYRIWNADVLSPFEQGHSWHVPAPRLDVSAMADAAQLVIGRHDFSSFQASGTENDDAEREVFESRVSAVSDWMSKVKSAAVPAPHELITYEVRGDGFLRHMVRTLVGSLVDVGRGARRPAWLGEVLASRDRTRAGRTAPACGLFLVDVQYEASGGRGELAAGRK